MQTHTFRAMILACSAIALAGCSTFQLTQEPFTPKGKKLAVIAGLTNPGSLEAAHAFADELGKASQFQVMPQKQVAQAIPNYPQMIKGPYDSAYFEIDVDYAKTDVSRVKEVHKNLGTDYLYVLWSPSAISHGRSSFFSKNYTIMQVIAQLYEFPGGREVGHGSYRVRIDPDSKAIVRDDLRYVTKELAEKTRMLK
jgi:hypothetical protein